MTILVTELLGGFARRVRMCSLLVVSIALIEGRGLAHEYRVEGIIENSYSGSVNTDLETRSYPFVVTVKGTGWQIKSLYEGDNYDVLGCDGTNVFEILHDFPKFIPGRKGKVGGLQNSADLAHPQMEGFPACITKGTQPIDSSWNVQVPWFALASGEAISRGARVLPPLYSPRVDALGNIVSPQITAGVLPPFLPRTATFTVSGELKKRIDDSPFLSCEPQNRKLLKLIPEELRRYSDGQLMAEYLVISSTNVGGLEIPTQFELSRYAYSKRNKTQRLATVKYRGKVSAISLTVEEPMLPVISDKLFVTDRRVQNRADRIDYVSYELTNNSWPAQDSAIVTSAYARKTGFIARLGLSSINPGRAAFVVGLIAALVVPSLVFLWQGRVDSRKNVAR